ncbi:MAG: HTTM domain-containing protein [Planctomycetes bacterium]|nr:HTTM domain-containing protein [Planctomycetota bacterium]
MIDAVQRYFTRLAEGFGQGWNRFWFTPSDPFTVCVLRIVAGVAALYFVGAHSFGLVEWFGPNGWLPTATVQRVMEAAPGEGAGYQLSYLNLISSPTLLWILHAVGLVIIATFALGLFTRVTNVLSLLVVLAYIHRAPMVAAQFEPVLALMLFYLCFAPSGRYLSLDSRRAKRDPERDNRSWGATVSLRLVQVHISALYLMMALTKLGAETWWEGGAVWWLMAQSQSRLADLTFVRNNLMLINAWTHAIVLFELAYGVLIWKRLARPLLIALSVVHWLLMALLTGLVGYCVLMIFAGAAFIPASTLRSLLRCGGDREAAAETEDAKETAAVA